MNVRVWGAAVALTLVACVNPMGPLPPGSWGGVGASLEVLADASELEFDCALGRIDEPLDLFAGTFDLYGTYRPGYGLPVREDDPPAVQSARFYGLVDGDRLTLMVDVLGFDEPMGPFTLRRGREATLHRCL